MVILEILFLKRRRLHLRLIIFSRQFLKCLNLNDQHLIRMRSHKLNDMLLIKHCLAPIPNFLCKNSLHNSRSQGLHSISVHSIHKLALRKILQQVHHIIKLHYEFSLVLKLIIRVIRQSSRCLRQPKLIFHSMRDLLQCSYRPVLFLFQIIFLQVLVMVFWHFECKYFLKLNSLFHDSFEDFFFSEVVLSARGDLREDFRKFVLLDVEGFEEFVCFGVGVIVGFALGVFGVVD